MGAEKTWCEGVDCANGAGMYANAQSCVHVGEGTVKSLKRRSVFTKARYSARCSSSLCLKPCHTNSALGSPWGTSMLMTLFSLLNRLRNVSGGS